MADVFISYCRSEGTSELVRRIAGELADMGISCWYDTQGLNIGEISSFIKAEIEQCKVFLLLLDEGANQSSYVFSEVCASFPFYRKQITPIPVQIGPFAIKGDLWFLLNGYNVLSYVSAETVPVSELVRKIAELPSIELSKPEQPDLLSAKVTQSGECGDITYTLYENGLLTISGVGSLQWWTSRYTILLVLSMALLPPFALIILIALRFCRPWNDHAEKISRVFIENGITSIDRWAFRGCKNLTNVTIPNSVTWIGDKAFYDCKHLKSVIVSANAAIENKAFPKQTMLIRR